jgi:transposase-like protein
MSLEFAVVSRRDFVKINGECHWLWRLVNQEGEVLKSYDTKR